MAGRFRRKGSGAPPELEVTTFMNLMVVLVPFLLLSAAFSEITIHDLNLPTIAESVLGEDDRNKVNLEVVIRRDSLDLLDRYRGRLQLFPNQGGRHDFAKLHGKLRDMKASYPHISHITLLLDPEVKYDTLVATMDVVRSYEETPGKKQSRRDLFPEVSIGDAPIVRSEGAGS